MGKVKWSQGTGRTGSFDRLGLKDSTVENNRKNLDQRQVEKKCDRVQWSYFAPPFYFIVCIFYNKVSPKTLKLKKKCGVILLLVINFLS